MSTKEYLIGTVLFLIEYEHIYLPCSAMCLGKPRIQQQCPALTTSGLDTRPDPDPDTTYIPDLLTADLRRNSPTTAG